MALFKCKMCGGSLEITDEKTVCECEYCGTVQTVPRIRDDNAANLFNRANHLRAKCEFDKAQELYEKIVNTYPDEAEAYWGSVLCKYGIEYVEDPKTLKKIPTCHRTQLESVKSDVDYLAALDHADAVQHSLYEKEAAEIDRLQKDILAIVHNEKPFDVFICYKESDDSGKRTQDSVIANDIYYQLTQNGFKVFYAAITLEDKLGQEYEPYIFAALNSAKAMLVIGTKPEYFEAVWVKNEWSRFLKIAKNDRNKLLIPCYKDMNAYDLPEEFSHLQAQDMGKIGFINDVVRGIKKVISAPAEKQSPAPAAPVGTASSNVENLLKRGNLCLEDRQWAEADKFFEEVLNEDVEEPRAYLGKLLAELNLSSEEKLNSYSKMIEKNSNFQKAMRFGDAAMKEKLENYNKQCIYNIAQGILTRNESEISDLENAITIFEAIADFSNAKEQIDKCREKIKEIKYSDAVSLFNTDSILNIESAIKIFEELGNYKDSAEMIDKCNEKINEIHYKNAIKNYNSDSIDDIESGAKLFKKLGVYKDSAAMIDKCREKIEQIKIEHEKAEAERLELERKAATKRKRKKTIITILVIIVIVLVVAGAILVPIIKRNATINALLHFRNPYGYDDEEKYTARLLGTISTGINHTVGLESDSAVMAVGENDYGQCDVSKWSDIITVSAGEYHTIGLKSDGTVVATGRNWSGECDVSNWRDIIAVSANWYYTVGLKSNGTVVATGINECGQCDVSDWTDIVAVSAGWDHTVGLKSDGTVVAVGENDDGQCDVSAWTDIVAVSAGMRHTIGLKSDGTVVAVGNNEDGECDVSGWTDIVAVSAGYKYTVGLKSDGTVVVVGENEYGQCNVSEWTGIIAVSAGRHHTVGLKYDGTVVAVGENDNGECDVSDWKNIAPRFD